MILTVTPEDLIRRCLWSDYKRFALNKKSEQELQNLVKENKPISMTEDLGYAIGLLKVIETDNLIHRFTVHMKEMINIKSTIFDKNVYISVKIIENELESFKKRFPDYWVADSTYEKSVKELIDHINEYQNTIKKFQIFEFKVKDKTIKVFQSKDIKKMIEN
jgi:DNA repair ATPase RecN